MRSLPLTLILTFVLLPSTSNRIFSSFLCEPFALDDDARSEQTYLREDLHVSCTSPEYDSIKRDAIALVLVWPVGVPLLYISLLWASRRAILSNSPTALSNSIFFLSSDYKSHAL